MTLVNGQATVTLTKSKLPASSTPYTVTVKYSGDDFVKPGTDTSTLRVRTPSRRSARQEAGPRMRTGLLLARP